MRDPRDIFYPELQNLGLTNVYARLRKSSSMLVRYTRICVLELRAQHQRTLLGVLWIPFSALLFTAVLALVFRHSGHFSFTGFFFYVLSGYTLWSFISRSITDSITLIQKGYVAAIHNGLNMPMMFAKSLMERLLEYFLNLAVFLLLAAFLLEDFLSLRLLLFLPGLAIISLTSLAVSYLINVATVLIPDMKNLVKTAVRLFFFASPVFWFAGDFKASDVRAVLTSFNPASYYLEIPRQAAGITSLNLTDWLVAFGLTLALSLAAFIAYRWSNSFIRNIR